MKMKTNLLFLMLLISIKSFSQECPCVKTAIIGTAAKTSIVHNNKVVAMDDVEINLGESVNLKTIKKIGKVTWYNNGKKILNTLVSPLETTEFTVISSLNGCPDAFDKVVVRVNKLLNEVAIYPNPTNGILTVTSRNKGIKSVQIKSLNGNELLNKSYKEDSKSRKINLSALIAGVYLVMIELTDNTIISKKIIKQ